MAWHIEEDGPQLRVTMNSNKVNAMGPSFFDDLDNCLNAIESSFRDRIVILQSENPKVFSAGLDMAYAFERLNSGDVSKATEVIDYLYQAYLRLLKLPNPLIASVEGAAYAGGFILVCCCDFRLASPSARFALNEIQLGVPMVDAFSELISTTVGSTAAERLMLRGDTISATQAKEIGFIHDISTQQPLATLANEWADSLNPDANEAYAYTKRVMRHRILATMESKKKNLDDTYFSALMSEASIRLRKNAYAKLRS